MCAPWLLFALVIVWGVCTIWCLADGGVAFVARPSTRSTPGFMRGLDVVSLY